MVTSVVRATLQSDTQRVNVSQGAIFCLTHETHLRNVGDMENETQRLLTEREAAAYLAVSRSWLRQQRNASQGPRHIVMGQKLIRYRVEDLDAFIKEHAQ